MQGVAISLELTLVFPQVMYDQGKSDISCGCGIPDTNRRVCCALRLSEIMLA